MEPCARQRSQSLLEWTLIAAFAGALAYPSIDPWLRPDAKRSALVEFRSPAKLPEHPRSIQEWQAYPSSFDAWFNDHFGLRDKLLRWNNLLDWFVFGVSPTSKLILGEGAWIYYADDKSIDVYRGVYPLSANELEGWRRTLTARRDWLAARDIRYLFVFVPNKDQVYPEHLPSALKVPGVSRLDQLLAHLETRSDLDVLDLRAAIAAEKANDQDGDYVYHRLGTHWTDRGAYAAYVAILERLKRSFPLLAPIPRDAFDVVLEGQGDTWAPHLYMDDLLQQKTLSWRLRSPGKAQFDAGAVPSTDTFESTNSDTSLPRAFILHDSFGPTLRPWLAENFSQAIWTWGWAFESRVARIGEVHPDVVIEMFVDRILVQNYPQVTGVEGPAPRRKAFEASSNVLLRLDASNLAGRLKTSGKAEFVPDAAADEPALTLRCRTVMDGVVIPELAFPATADVIVSIELESPLTGGIDLFFQKKGERSYERRRVCSEKIYKGANRLYIRLWAGDLAGPMFLHFRDPGLYRITSIEARAVRD